MMTRLSGAEFAAWRHLLGLTLDDAAEVLHVHRQTPTRWESGREPVPYGVTGEIAALKAEHDELVERMLDADEVVGIVRDKNVDTPRPRGWYVAAAARALEVDADVMVEWV